MRIQKANTNPSPTTADREMVNFLEKIKNVNNYFVNYNSFVWSEETYDNRQKIFNRLYHYPIIGPSITLE